MLTSSVVYVWRARLDETVAEHLPGLPPFETERASRFRDDEPRRRYAVSHRILRALLERLGLPSTVERDSRGKPFLPDHPDIQMSLSRSHGMALYAFACGAPVGVDIERIRPLPDWDGIAERYFPASFYQGLLDLPQQERETAFFRLWARLEASLKAVGLGLYGAAQELEGEWTIADVAAADGYAAAVAVQARDYRVVVEDFRCSPAL